MKPIVIVMLAAMVLWGTVSCSKSKPEAGREPAPGLETEVTAAPSPELTAAELTAKSSGDNAAAERPVLEAGVAVLETVAGEITCAKGPKLKSALGEEEINRIRLDGSDFIYFDKKAWTLSVCHQGKVVTGKFFGAPEEEAFIDVTRLGIEDLNGDGKPEFLVFVGQCVEGPCLGVHMLFQIDADRIRRLYTINAQTVDFVEEKGEKALVLNQICFNFDFGEEYSYIDIAVFTPGGALATIPHREIPVRFPNQLGKLKEEVTRRTAYAKSKGSKKDLNSARVQELFLQAYRGKSTEELTAEFKRIAPNPETDLPGVHGDPLALILKVTR